MLSSLALVATKVKIDDDAVIALPTARFVPPGGFDPVRVTVLDWPEMLFAASLALTW